ncbi:MAG: hypothetical protein IPH23_02115 [Gammaproteobacteria bacterium]|nr:hypothetical protein [Gammaproteobacteria bacterium]
MPDDSRAAMQELALNSFFEKLLRQPSASLRGARSLAYRLDRFRSLRATSRRFSTS